MDILHSLNPELFRRVIKALSPILRWAVIVVSILVILSNLTILIIFATFDNESAGFISGGDPRQFYRQLEGNLLDDYKETFGIAHNAGNSISTIVEALAYDADIIEIDVVLVNGKLYAAHWSPLSILGNRFFHGPRLTEVWGAAAQADVIKLDLRRPSTKMINVLLDFLHDRRRAKNEVVVVADNLEILTLLTEQKADVLRMLNVSDSGTLNNLPSDDETLKDIDGVSVRHNLLTMDSVKSLKERGLIVFAYTINNPERMNELVEYGVDGITTDNLAIMQLLGAQQRGEATLKGRTS